MNQRRAGLATLLGVLFLAFLVDPAMAQGSTSSTTTEELIWGLNSWLLYLAIPIAVLVEGILIYTVWKYRKQEEPLPTRENRRLEITWTIATAIILVAVGIGAYSVLANPYVTASSTQELDTNQEPIEIQVTGQKYAWTYTYPNETVQQYVNESDLGPNATVSEIEYTQAGTGTQGLVLPKDRPVRLNITSTDWLHAFHVPEMGLKSDAFPGSYNVIITKAQEEGEYQLYCAEYCGQGHSNMLGTVEVRSEEEFDQFLTEQTNESDN